MVAEKLQTKVITYFAETPFATTAPIAWKMKKLQRKMRKFRQLRDSKKSMRRKRSRFNPAPQRRVTGRKPPNTKGGKKDEKVI